VQSLREPKKCMVMDTPRSTIRVRMNGRETTVHHNAGCDSTAMEDRVDEIIGIEAWKRYDARLAKRRRKRSRQTHSSCSASGIHGCASIATAP